MLPILPQSTDRLGVPKEILPPLSLQPAARGSVSSLGGPRETSIHSLVFPVEERQKRTCLIDRRRPALVCQGHRDIALTHTPLPTAWIFSCFSLWWLLALLNAWLSSLSSLPSSFTWLFPCVSAI